MEEFCIVPYKGVQILCLNKSTSNIIFKCIDKKFLIRKVEEKEDGQSERRKVKSKMDHNKA